MPLFRHAELWGDVLDPGMDEALAPEFNYLVSSDPRYRVYSDAHEFFARTLVTDTMLDVVEGVIEALRGRGRHVYVLYSFFGGGKTHTLFAVYHALRDPDAFFEAVRESAELLPVERRTGFLERGRRIRDALRGLEPRTVIFHGKIRRFFPLPGDPQEAGGVRVRTLWGLLGAELGRYDVVRGDDEAVRAPAIDTLERLLRGVRVVVFADEVVEELGVLLRSGSEADRNYAMQVVSFLDNLLSAASRMEAAVLLTLPTERSEKGWRWESRYRGLEEYLDSIMRALGRVNSALLEPVPSGEYWRVLRRRLFRRVDRGYAARLAAELRSVYEDAREVFGEAAGQAELVRETYPFHPGFIDALRTVIEHNRELQKTRDALKFSRIILRGLYEKHRRGELAEDLVMAWHLDPSVPGLSSMLKGFDEYKVVVDVDLRKNVEKLGERADLGRLIAVSVFVSTFVYGSVLSRALFPTRQRIAFMVYEPSLFQRREWLPADIPAVLDELKNVMYYLWSDGERYWFWKVPNVNELVEKRAEELVRSKRPVLLEELTESENYLKGIVSRKLSQRRGGLGEKFKPRLFEKHYVLVQPSLEDVEDSPAYKLVVAWRSPREGFEKLVTHTLRAGKPARRTYLNTVVVLSPQAREVEEEAVRLYARIKAVEDVEKKLGDVMRDFEASFDPSVREALRKMQSTLLRNIRSDAENKLLLALLNGFDLLHYPAGGPSVVPVNASRLGVTALCLAEKAEETLIRENKAIATGPFSFDYLVQLLERAGKSLEEPHFVREIVDEFRINPSLPMVPESLVLEALSEGYERAKLLVKKPDGRLLYARIVEGQCSGATPSAGAIKLGPEDEVVLAVSPRGLELLLGFLRGLEGEEERPDGTIIVRRADVYIEGDIVSLEEFASIASTEPSVVDAALFCIVEEKRRPGVRLKLSQQRLSLVEGEKADIRVLVEAVGGLDPGTVNLRLEAPSGVEARLGETVLGAGSETVLTIRALRQGTYSIVIEAIPEHGDSDRAVVEVNVEGREKIVDCREAASGAVKEISLRGRWSSMDIVLEDLASAYPDADARLSLVDEASGVRFEAGKPLKLRDLVEVAKTVAALIENIGGGELRAEVAVILPDEISVEDVMQYTDMLGDDVECSMRVLQ